MNQRLHPPALLISDIPGNPYYPLFTPDQYGQFLSMSKGSVERAVVPAAISASMIIGSDYTREVIGDLQLSRNAGANYLKALDALIKNNGKSIPEGLMPWSASVPSRNKLLDFVRCDCEDDRFKRPPIAPEYEQEIRDLIADVKGVHVELDDNEAAITQQGVSITSLTARVATSEDDIVELMAMDALQDTTLTEQAQALTSLQSSVATQGVSITSLETKATQAATDISGLKTTTTNTNADVANITTRVTTVENEIVNLKATDQKLEINDLYGVSNEYS